MKDTYATSALALGLFVLLAAASGAQESADSPVYRIGPKDLVEIRVFEEPTLNVDLRVTEDGTVDLPLLGSFSIRGLSEDRAASLIQAALEELYLQRASVSVRVSEFRSQPISVIGAVKTPGNLELSGRWTLLEALTAAGGLTDNHGSRVHVLRRAENGLSDQLTVDLDALLVRGDARYNIPIYAADLINVPTAVNISIFCLGEVEAPGAVVFKSTERATLLGVIAKAGGLTERATSKVRIRRQRSGDEIEEIEVSFKRILAGKDPDVAMRDGDVVVVKESFFSSEPYSNTGPTGLSDEPLDWHYYLGILRQRWRSIAAGCALALVAAAIHFLITPESYRATTTLQIEQRGTMSVTSDPNPWLEAWIGMKYYPTQYRLLTSRGLAERVVLDLGLMDDPRFNSSPRQLFGDADGDRSAAADEAALARLAKRVQAGLEVEPVKETELVELSFVTSNAEMASRVANGIADAFIDWGIETRSATVGRASEFLSKQIDTLKAEINEKEQQLQSYGRSTDILNLDPESNTTLQQLDRLNEDYVAALGDRLQKEARRNELRHSPADSLANRVSGGLVSELQKEQMRLEAEYESRLRTYKPEWPEMVDLEARIEEGRGHLEDLIAEQTREALATANADYQTARRREQSLADEIARVKAQVMDRNASAVEFRNLEMEIQNRRRLLDEMLRRLSEAGVRARLQSERETNVRVIDRALTPTSPFRPSLLRNLIVGLFAGLGFGGGSVLLLQLMDRTIKGPADIQQRLDLPVLAAVLDLDHRSSASRYGYYEPRPRPEAGEGSRRVARIPSVEPPQVELLPQKSPRSAVSEAYRALRTALMLSSADELRVVAVTSPESGDGKTATAVNLAVVMAQLGRRTLLVDGDLRRPRLHQIFERDNSSGLVHALARGADPASLYRTTGIENLSLCPSGPHPPNPSELLASDRMASFLGRATADFDTVVVDTPPALVVTDAVVIGALCDGMVLCLRANKTLHEDAEGCADRLRQAGVRLLGSVLNRFRPLAGDTYSRRYYSYETYSEKPDKVQGSAA